MGVTPPESTASNKCDLLDSGVVPIAITPPAPAGARPFSGFAAGWVTHYNTGGIAQITVDPLALNTVVAAYDGSQVRICANGVAGTSMNYSSGITPSAGPLEFGRGRSDSFNINGLIYQVTILDFALPLEDALRLSFSGS